MIIINTFHAKKKEKKKGTTEIKGGFAHTSQIATLPARLPASLPASHNTCTAHITQL
jgi:hypothetical protein